jgi:type I restriction enzyme, R subunit
VNKYNLSERDICTKFITPAIQQAGWEQHQFREEVSLTDGRVMVRGNLAARIHNPEAKGGPKRADFVLYARPSVPLAVVEVTSTLAISLSTSSSSRCSSTALTSC